MKRTCAHAGVFAEGSKRLAQAFIWEVMTRPASVAIHTVLHLGSVNFCKTVSGKGARCHACKSFASTQVCMGELPQEPQALADLIPGRPLEQPDFMKPAHSAPRYLQQLSGTQMPGRLRLCTAAHKRSSPSAAARSAIQKHCTSGMPTQGHADAGMRPVSSPMEEQPVLQAGELEGKEPRMAKPAADDADYQVTQISQQEACAQSASYEAQAAVPGEGGEQGVLGKKPRRALKQAPEGPSSGLNYWLQIRQAANKQPGQSKGPIQQRTPEAAHEPETMQVQHSSPSSRTKAKQTRGMSQQACVNASPDNELEDGRQFQGHQGTHSDILGQRQGSTNAAKMHHPANAQQGGPGPNDSDSSSESSQEMLALDRHGPQPAPSHVEVSR